MTAGPTAPSQTNLEPGLASFIGREAEHEAIARHFASGAGVVVLWGPGGIGKTRLAKEFCLQQGERFLREDAGGIWFCDLSAATSEEDLAATVAQVLELSPPAGGADLLGALAQSLSSLPGGVLVLDNADGLVSRHAEAIARWARPYTDQRILLTTRTLPDGIWDDHAVELGPLPTDSRHEQGVPDAVALFVERARLHRPGYAPLGPELDRVHELMRWLGGMPLAIELAAARMDVLDLDDLMRRLSRGFGSLVPTGLPGQRQIAVTGAIAASWGMLSEVEQRFLAQCAVFRGGFTFAAAEEVVGAPSGHDPALLLGGLRRKSLVMVQRDGEAGASRRFQLHESVRDFCARHVAGTALEADVAERHSRYFGARAAAWRGELVGPRGAEALGRLTQEAQNLRAVVERWLSERTQGSPLLKQALAAALGLEPVYLARGPLRSFAGLLEQLLRALPECEASAVDRARIRLSLGRVRRSLGEIAAARDDLEEAARLTNQAPASLLRCEAQIELGVLHQHERQLDEARERYLHALEIREGLEADSAGPEAWHAQARILGNLGAVEHDLGNWDAAIDAYEESLTLFRRVGHRRHEGIFLTNLALAQQEVGADERAMETYAKALRLLEAGGDWRLLAIALTNQGWLLLSMGDPTRAERLQLRARRMLRRLGERRSEALCLSRLGATYCALGQLDKAGEAFDGADDVVAPLEDPLASALLRLHRGFLALALAREHEQRGEADRARRCRQRAQDLVAEVRSPRGDAPSIFECSDDARLAVRMLTQGLQASMPPAERGDALLVGPDAMWFRAPSQGDPCDLRRRGVLRKLLQRLVVHRRARPGEALSLDDLFAAGWPGQRATPSAQANRVYVAVATLKKLGLRSCLDRRDDGYLLRKEVELVELPLPLGEFQGSSERRAADGVTSTAASEPAG